MGWKAYRLVYKAKSPIHIGWHTLGYIKLTRYYITGRNIWGALTANIVRTIYGHDDYHGVGELLKKDILVSYFYPAIDYQKPFLPNFQKDGLYYGNYPVSDFERLFIQSYGQTAVLPESNTAEDQSLHESDFISHYIEEEYTERRQNVYFVGYVFIHNNAHYKGQVLTLETIERSLMEIFIGGDRKYGWGRLMLETGKTDEVKNNTIFGNQLDTQNDCLQITVSVNNCIPAHLELKTEDTIKVKGDIEPLLGLEWCTTTNDEGETGTGKKISKAKICWVPGSIMQEIRPLKIGEFGILTS
ncbi:MAG: hypothetical protein DYG83_14570 [Candidatus Brocadia sp. AMX2]|uniref:Uncharacterized conserved protein n=2 Tax=Candidatus Brocadiaceae TaxID=1127830 RepID=A0ABQ0JSR3_9BACT|nr:MAG: hypothetical protein EDM70_11065 [Candidatus Brocadia sp. AMX2]KXK25959.1 MAG: hypothetical protein UZ01_03192 [Candidatus Brocadia sinica]MBC6933652.1 hypothetical protein [Candidatus Brocadia sp.]MBL1170512.1 hypothetical protein [Candidatus Brocadia sp. AMX1]GAN31765.1 uncharacterized conserved protein [Candidatus Brocadia sinica JPN1]